MRRDRPRDRGRGEFFTIGVGDTRSATHVFALPERKLLALSLIAFLAVFVEGSVTDWSTVDVSSEVGAPSGAAAIGFSGYALMMIVGRLLGDSVVRALGRTRIILWRGWAVRGHRACDRAASEPSAVVGFALVGLGVANMAPAAFSARAAAASSPSLGVCRLQSTQFRGPGMRLGLVL